MECLGSKINQTLNKSVVYALKLDKIVESFQDERRMKTREVDESLWTERPSDLRAREVKNEAFGE